MKDKYAGLREALADGATVIAGDFVRELLADFDNTSMLFAVSCNHQGFRELHAKAAERDALMAEASKLADALMALLAETEHKTHASCTDGGYCPVRDARLALGAWQDAIASNGKEGS